jgi:hypothetical protein
VEKKMKIEKAKPKIFARVFSESGLHVCDTEPADVEQICLFVDIINRHVKRKLRGIVVKDSLFITDDEGKFIAASQGFSDRDLMIFFRNAINDNCRGLRAVSQVEGGMRYDLKQPGGEQ